MMIIIEQQGGGRAQAGIDSGGVMIGLMTTRNQQHNRQEEEEKTNKARDLKSENYDGRALYDFSHGRISRFLFRSYPQGCVTSLADGWSAILATYGARSRSTLRDPL